MSIIKRSLCAVCMFFFTFTVYSLPSLTSGNPAVKELSILFINAGLVFPSESYPMGREELARYAQQLAQQADSPDIRQAAREWLESFDYNTEKQLITSDMKLSAWAGGRNDAIPWQSDLDFRYNHIETQPFFDWGLSADRDGSGGIAISAELRTEYTGDFSNTSLFVPQEGNPVPMENYFITTGYFYKRFDDISLLLGRTPIQFGDSSFSSGMISERLPFMDSFRLTWDFGPLKMTAYTSSLENRLGKTEKAKLDDAAWAVDESFFNIADYAFVNGIDLAFGSTNIFLSARRFEYAFKRIRLAVTSMQIVSRENNYVHIGDFFPVFTWHNAELAAHNNSLHFDATMIPMPGLKLAFQVGWDDINAAEAFGTNDSDIPTIYFYLAGAEWNGKFGELPAGINLELGTSHYLWGIFSEWDEDFGANYLSRAIYRYKRDKDYVLLPLTSPYGPGVSWISGSFSIQTSKSITLKNTIELRWRNPGSDLVSTTYVGNPSLEDADRYGDHRFALLCEWNGEDTIHTGRSGGSTFIPSLFAEGALLIRDGSYGWEGSIGGSLRIVNNSSRQALNALPY